jgi:hypothetical protein
LVFDGHFWTDLVAAAADRRADGSQKIRRFGAELHGHFSDGFSDNAAEGAAPPGVHGSDGALLEINEENGYTVGSLHTEEQVGLIRSRGIAATRFAWRSIEKMDNIGVNLFERDERQFFRGEH